MKDAKGHGSNPHGGAAHQSGVEALTPMGLPRPQLIGDKYRDADQPAASAFYQGHDAYLLGHPESHNPHPDPYMNKEWARGYRNTRKDDRFKATIIARRAARASKS